MEIKNIAFEKLNDLEFKNTIQVHDLVWQSGVPNYLSCRISVPGADPGFQVRGAHLKKIAPSGGRREKCWGISCEKSRFYAKKSYFFPILGGARAGCAPPPP